MARTSGVEGTSSAHDARAESVHTRLRVALDAGGLGTWRWDAATGEVSWDPRLEELFGLAPGSFDGSYDTWLALIHPDDRAAVEAAVDEAVERGGGYRVEHRVVWPDGSVRWLVAAGTATLGEGGVTGSIGCVMDVTDHVESQQVQERLAAEAVAAAQAERLHRERLEFLTAVNDALVSAADEADVLERVVWTFAPNLGDWCALYLHDDEAPTATQFEVAHPDPEVTAKARAMLAADPPGPHQPRGVPNVLRTGLPERWDDHDGEEPPVMLARLLDELPELRVSSVLTLPLLKHGRVLGALQIGRSEGHYDDDDLSLAAASVGRIAASIEVRRLTAREQRIARALQDSLLPDRLPAVPGLDMAVRYWPAGQGSEVGGDFYDVFHVAEGRWGAVIGDVCGTGPGAAALTGLARHSLRMSAWNGNDPAATIHWLNRAVHETGTTSFLTATDLTLEPRDDGVEVEAASGGHPHPILVRADGTVVRVEATGTLLGPFREVTVEPVALRLAVGDTLLLYTDGITDLPLPHALDDDDLDRIVASAAALPDAESVAQQLRTDIEAVLPISERADDMALLVIRVTDRSDRAPDRPD